MVFSYLSCARMLPLWERNVDAPLPDAEGYVSGGRPLES